MARRRLTPAAPTSPAAPEDAAEDAAAQHADLETKARYPLGIARTVSRPPIAEVAGAAAERAALAELTHTITEAREEGRLVVKLKLEKVTLDHLVRDRMAIDQDGMTSLVESLRARGQQTPIEVVALEDGRYGLISGWRRVAALERIGARTVLAVVRHPEGAAEAYLAMVEENEIRQGLSYYERARVAAEAARLGVYPTTSAAVASLFISASRAKRSKITSFVAVHDALGAALKFPAAIPERLGLALAQAIPGDPDFGPRLRDVLRKAAPDTAAAERTVLERALRRAPGRSGATGPAGDEVAPGICLDGQGRRLTLSGPGVTAELRQALAAWLATRR